LTAGDPYAGKTDYQVLVMAQAAYRRAGALPPRSGRRRAEWEAFDHAMGELMRRAMSHVLWKIHEMEAAGEDNIPDGSDDAVILELTERNGSGTAGEPRP
jgi:hypothetical protein